MESFWSYDSGDKGFMPDFPNSSTSKNEFTNWGFKGYDDNTMMLSDLEVGFSDHDSLIHCLSSNGSGGGDFTNIPTIASNSVSGDDESSSNCKESSLIDLKLGRFGDSAIRNVAPKRMKVSSSLNCQPAFCQVYGCNKDLGSSKDYHKRHKVCDVHSKTAKVIVNGIEQRFCQQCSRFHLLREFDDGKRSCRRRLAGHNERRRKPLVGLHSSRPGRMPHSYNGFGRTSPNRTTMTTSFICQDILPTTATTTIPSLFESFVVPDIQKTPKRKDSCFNARFLQNPYEIPKQSPYSDPLNTCFDQYNASYSLPQNSVFGAECTDRGLPEPYSNLGCALSLLSPEPQNSSGLPISSQQNFGFLSEVVASEDPFGNASNMASGFSESTVQVKQEDDSFCWLKIT